MFRSNSRVFAKNKSHFDIIENQSNKINSMRNQIIESNKL